MQNITMVLRARVIQKDRLREVSCHPHSYSPFAMPHLITLFRPTICRVEISLVSGLSFSFVIFLKLPRAENPTLPSAFLLHIHRSQQFPKNCLLIHTMHLFCIYLFFKLYFIYYAITVVLIFLPLPRLHPSPPTHSHNPHTIVHVHGSCIHSLSTLFPIL